ncbi:uncharacterized protein [Leptinotarsa decemlineata]|uniref:uncharacterized protein n=1 Tax=Leptinotarsa decemlineata TaxID=7539 RepID=UPI003D307AC0
MKFELQDGAPPGSAFECHPTGWMQMEIFNSWFNHFLKFSKPTKDDPILLVLDVHATHMNNLDFIEKARDNHVTVLFNFQPLDVAFMAPFNTYSVQSIAKFFRNNPGRTVTQFQVSRLLGEAFLEASTPVIAIKGFRKCGIVPIDENVFTELDYAASETTEITLQEDTAPEEENTIIQICASSSQIVNNSSSTPTVAENSNTAFIMVSLPYVDHPIRLPSAIFDPSIPSTSSAGALETTSDLNSPPNKKSTLFAVSPREIVPVPKVNQIFKRETKQKKGTATVLTSSPYKASLMAIKKGKEDKENAKQRRLEAKREREIEKKQQALTKRWIKLKIKENAHCSRKRMTISIMMTIMKVTSATSIVYSVVIVTRNPRTT